MHKIHVTLATGSRTIFFVDGVPAAWEGTIRYSVMIDVPTTLKKPRPPLSRLLGGVCRKLTRFCYWGRGDVLPARWVLIAYHDVRPGTSGIQPVTSRNNHHWFNSHFRGRPNPKEDPDQPVTSSGNARRHPSRFSTVWASAPECMEKVSQFCYRDWGERRPKRDRRNKKAKIAIR